MGEYVGGEGRTVGRGSVTWRGGEGGGEMEVERGDSKVFRAMVGTPETGLVWRRGKVGWRVRRS